MKQLIFKVLCLFAIVTLASCGGGGGGGSRATGQISVTSDFEPTTRSVPGYADFLKVTIQPPQGVTLPSTIPNPFLLDRDHTSQLLNNLPVGQYTLHMEALTADKVVGTATRTVDVAKNQSATIDVSANLESQIQSVAIEGSSDVGPDEETDYTAYAKDDEGATLFNGAGFEWSSSDTDTLSIDETGHATAHTMGDVTLTATLKGTNLSATKSVEVTDGAVHIQLAPATFEIAKGGTHQFTAQVTGVANKAVTWSILPTTGVGTISNAGLYTAGQTAGFVYVRATSAADPNVKAESVVHVLDANVSHRIAYDSEVDGEVDIWLTDLMGIEHIRVTNSLSSTETQPEFSPDGATVAFIRFSMTGGNLWVKNLNSGVETQLTDSSVGDQLKASHPTWTPDGSYIYFTGQTNLGGTRIYRIQPEGTNLSVVIDGAGNTDQMPSINPQGTKIAFFSNRIGGPQLVFTANLDGSNAQFVAPALGTPFQQPVSWSPDGTKIAYVTINGGFLATIQDVVLNQLVEQFPLNTNQITNIGFSPYEGFLIGSGTNLYLIRLSDKEKTQLTNQATGFSNAKLQTTPAP